MKIAIIGHSHIQSACVASKHSKSPESEEYVFVQLRDTAFMNDPDAPASADFTKANLSAVTDAVASAVHGADLVAICVTGNEHIATSIVRRNGIDETNVGDLVAGRMKNHRMWLGHLATVITGRVVVVPPPPPIRSEEHILANAKGFAPALREHGLAPAKIRQAAWQAQIQCQSQFAVDLGWEFFKLPAGSMTGDGFMLEEHYGKDPTHGNARYGKMLMQQLARLASKPSRPASPSRQDRNSHPYSNLPERAFWRKSVSNIPAHLMDPVGDVPFHLSPSDKVATAGSCFAQHIAKRIRESGFHFLVTEPPVHVDAATPQFTANYGNIYTARQLLQLFDRAYGAFVPRETAWQRPDGRYCDPFRPQFRPEGHASPEAVIAERETHLAAVREMFESVDVFVFTLGLTECWTDLSDGAAFPVAPGVVAGVFDPALYTFKNQTVQEIVDDLTRFIGRLRSLNPRVRMILTVSPVPLVATYESDHVLSATTYSKAVLRVAAETMKRTFDGVAYFPSFEIITGNHSRGRYFGPDLRLVTESGVDHVMRVFMSRMTTLPPTGVSAAESPLLDDYQALDKIAEAECDEELLDRK